MKIFILLFLFIFVNFSVTKEINFLDVCKNNNDYSTGTQHTIKVILEKYNTNNCETAYNIIKKNKSLTLMDTVTNFYAISKLDFLTHLTLMASKTPDKKISIRYLTKLKNLKFLNISFYVFANYKEFKELAPLEQLVLLSPDLNYGQNALYDDLDINKIVIYKNMRHIKYLTVSGYNITHVDKIKYLTNLYQLFIADNNIQDLTGIKDLKNLHQLDLKNNPLKDYFEKINYKGSYLMLQREDVTTLKYLINMQ